MRDLLLPVYHFFDPILLGYFAIIMFSYLLFLVVGTIGTFKRFKQIQAEDFSYVLKSNNLPEITFIIPTYNDVQTLLPSIETLRKLTFQNKKIIIVNDGSTDETMEFLSKELKLKEIPLLIEERLPTTPLKAAYQSSLDPNITVLDKKNGQKQDAINMALNACQTTYFSIVDADTLIDNTHFEHLIRPIFENPNTIAVGAAIKIFNGCEMVGNQVDSSKFPTSFLAGMQAVEYERSFLMRMGWEYLNSNYIISGAFGVFVRDVVIEAGGFGPTIANDLEIILRLTRIMKATKTHFRISYNPDPVAWTYVPETWKELRHQRIQWQFGTLESLWFNKKVLFNPKYGTYGLFVFPYLIIFEALEPIVEFFGYIYIIIGIIFGIISFSFISMFFLVTIGLVFVQTLFSLVIEEFSFKEFSSFRSLFTLIFYSLIENFGYKQMNLIWRVRGTYQFLCRLKEVRIRSAQLNKEVDKTIKKGVIRW